MRPLIFCLIYMFKLIIEALIDLLIIFFIIILGTLFRYDILSYYTIYEHCSFWILFRISFWTEI